MKIAIGSDEAGFELKNQVKGYLEGKGCKVVDERGVLVCGTGIGMAMTANKMPGIRAAVGHDAYSVERMVLSNNAQVITFGARVVSYVYVTRMLDIWLSLEFKDGSSTPKVDEMCAIERRHAQDER